MTADLLGADVRLDAPSARHVVGPVASRLRAGGGRLRFVVVEARVGASELVRRAVGVVERRRPVLAVLRVAAGVHRADLRPALVHDEQRAGPEEGIGRLWRGRRRLRRGRCDELLHYGRVGERERHVPAAAVQHRRVAAAPRPVVPAAATVYRVLVQALVLAYRRRRRRANAWPRRRRIARRSHQSSTPNPVVPFVQFSMICLK